MGFPAMSVSGRKQAIHPVTVLAPLGRLRSQLFSLIFFNYHEGDIVSLRHILSKVPNGFQDRLLDSVTSRGRLPLDEFKQSYFSEHFSLRIFRVRESVRIDHQDVVVVEMKGAGFIGGEIEHPQEISIGDQLFDLSRSGAE